MTELVRCAVYTRKSTDEGLDQNFNSLEAQREAGEAYVASQRSEGWVLVKRRYDDGGYSGANLQRPALNALLEDVAAKKVDVIVVYKIDRLSRSLLDFAKLISLLDAHSVTFISVTQAFNTTTSMGRLTLNILLSFAQFERELISERIRDKVAASKRRGIWMGGTPPLGYDIIDRKLVVNAQEALTVNFIFQKFVELRRLNELERYLASREIRSKFWRSGSGEMRGGKALLAPALAQMLRNKLYLGLTVHKGKSYPGQHQALIEQPLYDEVQLYLSSSLGKKLGKKSTSQKTFLSGLIYSDEGASLSVTYTQKHNGRRFRYYVTPSSAMTPIRISAGKLEGFVSRLMLDLRLPLSHQAGGFSMGRSVTRVVVGEGCLIMVLLEDHVLAWWRNLDGSDLISDREVFDRFIGELPNAIWERRDGNIHIKFPLDKKLLKSSARTQVLANNRLVKALARAWEWRQWLISGRVNTISALANEVGLERRHVRRTLSLAFLSPSLICAVVDGRDDRKLSLSHYLEAGVPALWSEQ